jgi:hypothetical protein
MICEKRLIISYDNKDEACAWKELTDKLVKIYKDEFSYTNIVEALMASQQIFYDLLMEE